MRKEKSLVSLGLTGAARAGLSILKYNFFTRSITDMLICL